MNVDMNFKIEDYLSEDEMDRISHEVWENILMQKMCNRNDAERILTNAAYEVVGKFVEKNLHIDLDKYITERVVKILQDDNSLNYVLFKDGRQYGDNHLGPLLETIDEIIKTKLRCKVEEAAERIVENVDFKSKKFEKMVAGEVAKIVAQKLSK